MTPLIRKEIRLLLPFLGIAILLAAVPVWILPLAGYVAPMNQVVFWSFGFGIMLLGLAPFGQEFSLGTFSSLLAQPLQRKQIWLIKLVLISAAALLALLVFVLSIHLRLDSILKVVTQQILEIQADRYGYGDFNRVWYLNLQHSLLATLHSYVFWKVGLLLVLVGLAGGLWTSLLFRQTGAALWFTVLVPGVIFGCIDWFVQDNSARDIVAFVTLGIYSIAGFVWARRMFMLAQDAQWLGDTISLSGLSPAKAQAESAMARRRRPLHALLRKEFQSQQINFLIAFGLLVLHVCTLGIRGLYSFPKNADVRFIMEAIPFLWLLLPWLLGSVAVAEERKLGTSESQLCLPVARRLQFTVKFCMTMVLGIVLGAVVPWALERIGILFHISSGVLVRNGSGVSVSDLCEIAAVIAFLSFFASTLTRNTLQALGAAIVAIILCFFLASFVLNLSFQDRFFTPWKGSLIFFIGVPIFALTVLWRSFAHFNLLSVTWKAALRSFALIALSLLLAAGLTTFLYQRAWQLAMSLEPRHAPPVLSGPVQPKLRFTRDRIFALLPDGRLWTGASYTNTWLGDFYDSSSFAQPPNTPEKMLVPFPETGRFVGSSNWTDIAANWAGLAAIQSDGSLWTIFQWGEPRRMGTDSDWQSVAAGSDFFLALKKDGTIWGWGSNDSGALGADVGKAANGLVRVGSDSDWVKVFASHGSAFGIKRNGSVWKWGYDRMENTRDPFREGTGARIFPRKCGFSGTNLVSLSILGYTSWRDLALGADGILQIEGRLPVFGRSDLPVNVLGTPAYAPGAVSEGVLRLYDRDKTTFADVEGIHQLVGLTKTGTILQNQIDRWRNSWGQTVWRPSKYNDWIAVDSGMTVLFAGLAADGTLSFWRDPVSLMSNPGPFLGPTRKPVWTLNILAGAK